MALHARHGRTGTAAAPEPQPDTAVGGQADGHIPSPLRSPQALLPDESELTQTRTLKTTFESDFVPREEGKITEAWEKETLHLPCAITYSYCNQNHIFTSAPYGICGAGGIRENLTVGHRSLVL